MTTLASVVSCLSDYDPNALPVAQAQAIMRDFVQPVGCLLYTSDAADE